LVRGIGKCPRCSGQITYSFSGKKVALLVIPAAVLYWYAAPIVGGLAALIACALLCLLLTMKLEKWF
jgi:hypothetical protein